MASFMLPGCKPRDVNAELSTLVTEFHARYNEQKFGEIYDHSSRIFQRRMSRAANTELFASLYARHGRVVSTKQDSQAHDTRLGGDTFLLTYTTTFERGTATEFIGFRQSPTERGELLLAVYERD
jgi:hypothetical protein